MDLDPRWKGHFGGNIWQDSPAVDILELIHMGSAAMRPLATSTVATCLFYSYNKPQRKCNWTCICLRWPSSRALFSVLRVMFSCCWCDKLLLAIVSSSRSRTVSVCIASIFWFRFETVILSHTANHIWLFIHWPGLLIIIIIKIIIVIIIIIIMWLVRWWTLLFLQECSMLVDSMPDDTWIPG